MFIYIFIQDIQVEVNFFYVSNYNQFVLIKIRNKRKVKFLSKSALNLLH